MGVMINTLISPMEAASLGTGIPLDEAKRFVEANKKWPSEKYEFEMWKVLIWSRDKGRANLTNDRILTIISLDGFVDLHYPEGIEFTLKTFDGKENKYSFKKETKN